MAMDDNTKHRLEYLYGEIEKVISPQCHLTVVVRYAGKISPPVILTTEANTAALIETIIATLPPETKTAKNDQLQIIAEQNLALRHQIVDVVGCVSMTKGYLEGIMHGEYNGFVPSRKAPLLSIEDVIFRKATQILGDISGTGSTGKRNN